MRDDDDATLVDGNSFFDTAALLTSMHNFPLEKGTVAGTAWPCAHSTPQHF